MFVCLPTNRIWKKSLLYQARPFLSWWTSSWAELGLSKLAPLVSLMIDHPLSWRDKPMYRQCAPEALALLSTACAHNFYTCRRRFCLICSQEHPRGPPPLNSSGRKEVHCLCWFYHTSAQPTNFCIAHIHFTNQFSWAGNYIHDIIYPREMTFTSIIEFLALRGCAERNAPIYDRSVLSSSLAPPPKRAWGRESDVQTYICSEYFLDCIACVWW